MDQVHVIRHKVLVDGRSQRQVAKEFGISRVTARKAIDQLVEQGLIVRRRGSGNYIAPRLEQPLSKLTSFSMLAWMRSAEICFRAAAICGSAEGASWAAETLGNKAPRATARTAPENLRRFIRK